MRTCSFGFHGIPNIAVKVVVAGEQKAAGLAERDAGDAADDVVVAVHRQLLIGAHVKETTRRVVAARCEGIAVREKLQTHQHIT